MAADDSSRHAVPGGTLLQGRYQIERKLGSGGFADAYLATDQRTGKPCVVKKLALAAAGNWKTVELFEREAKVLASLDHPRIPRHLDFFTVEDERSLHFYLVQAYVRGQNLAERLATNKRLLTNDALRIARDIADVLAYLHRKTPPIIHRDIKPSNIILGPHNRAYLIDFGAVRDAAKGDEHEAGGGSTIVGTYGYMPFEQFSGRALPQSDVYALGATLIHVLSGQPPANLLGEDMRLAFQPYATASEDVVALLERMVEPDWSRRFADGTALQEALARLKAPRSKRARPARAAAGIAGACLVTAAGWSAWHHLRPNADGVPAAQQAQKPMPQASRGLPVGRNMLTGSYDLHSGWLLPPSPMAGPSETLRLLPGQSAYRDIDVARDGTSSGAGAHAVTAGVGVLGGSSALATIALWAEPAGKLLGDVTVEARADAGLIGSTVTLPRGTRRIRVALHCLPISPAGPDAHALFGPSELVLHPPASPPAFAGRMVTVSQKPERTLTYRSPSQSASPVRPPDDPAPVMTRQATVRATRSPRPTRPPYPVRTPRNRLPAAPTPVPYEARWFMQPPPPGHGPDKPSYDRRPANAYRPQPQSTTAPRRTTWPSAETYRFRYRLEPGETPPPVTIR